MTKRPVGRSASPGSGYRASSSGRGSSQPTDRASQAAILRQLAALTEALASGGSPRHPRRETIEHLSPGKLYELADLVAAGRSPPIGWWKRAYDASRRCES